MRPHDAARSRVEPPDGRVAFEREERVGAGAQRQEAGGQRRAPARLPVVAERQHLGHAVDGASCERAAGDVDALDALLAGKPIQKTTAVAFGCTIKRA